MTGRTALAVGLWLAVLACVPKPAGPRDLVARGEATFVADEGVSMAPVGGLEGVQILGLAVDEVIPIDPEVAADGTVTFRDVPAGAYFLVLGDRYVRMTTNTIDTTQVVLGRRDVEVAPTSLIIEADDMNAWERGDALSLWSTGAGLDVYLPEGGGVPAVGDTTLGMGITVGRVVDASRGDTLWVAHLEQRPLPGTSGHYRALTEAFKGPSASFEVEGQYSTSFTWNLKVFEELAPEVTDAPLAATHSLEIRTLPDRVPEGVLTRAPLLAEVRGLDSNGLTSVSTRVEHGNPYRGWTTNADLIVAVEVQHRASYLTDDGRGLEAIGRVGVLESQADFQARDGTQVVITPPRNVLVDGRPARGGTLTVSSRPTVSWDEPATGRAQHYEVSVAGGAKTVVTRERSLRLPPGLLEPGAEQVLVVRAVQTAAVVDERPFEVVLPYAYADYLTAPIKVESR